MKIKKPLKISFYFVVALIVAIVVYKAYLNLKLDDFSDVHNRQLELIENRTASSDTLHFGVVGNINNSIGIFEKQLIPALNQSSIEFVISAGNAVLDGGEDKYRALKGTMSHLEKPHLLTFGENESDGLGSFRFFEHYGPYYFSFEIHNARFIFLDSTDKTSWKWQLRWLKTLFKNDTSEYHFVFINHPLHKIDQEQNLFPFEKDYLQPETFRRSLIDLFEKHGVDAVFSANVSGYSHIKENGVSYITTGGAGGLDLNADSSRYHYVDVQVLPASEQIQISQIAVEGGQHFVFRQLENIWFTIYSFFYVGYLNFFLILGVLILISIKLYARVFKEPSFYPSFDADPSPWLDKSFKVAMFTNNFLPFIGGVPISVNRLRRGLEIIDDKVNIVAPEYKNQKEDEQVLRVSSLVTMGQKSEFRLANIFSPSIWKLLKSEKPDIIHVHHPFWLGSLGLLYAKWLGVPAVFTYHTRLEHYAHFVPIPGLLFKNLISHALIRRFANKCDGIIVPTYSVERYLYKIGVRKPAFVQPTGVEFERFQQVEDEEVQRLRKENKIGDDELVMISVSRLSNEKNINFLIDAAAKLHQKENLPPFRFLIIGDGHERERLQQKIDDLQLSEVVTLAGSVEPDNMRIWYHLGDLFLFASKSETQGMVILEAMSAGLPVVAVRATGIEDVIKDGHNGYKTPERLDVWTNRVVELMTDDEKRAEMAKHALEFAEDYSIEAFGKRVHEIYAAVYASDKKKDQKEE